MSMRRPEKPPPRRGAAAPRRRHRLPAQAAERRLSPPLDERLRHRELDLSMAHMAALFTLQDEPGPGRRAARAPRDDFGPGNEWRAAPPGARRAHLAPAAPGEPSHRLLDLTAAGRPAAGAARVGLRGRCCRRCCRDCRPRSGASSGACWRAASNRWKRPPRSVPGARVRARRRPDDGRARVASAGREFIPGHDEPVAPGCATAGTQGIHAAAAQRHGLRFAQSILARRSAPTPAWT